jgi:hypothetical protein
LFVAQEGVTFDHHFLLPEDGANFKFLSGTYRLVVFAKLVGEGTPRELMTIALTISESQASQLNEPNTGIYFDWGPDQQAYHAHIDKKPELELSTEELLELVVKNKI